MFTFKAWTRLLGIVMGILIASILLYGLCILATIQVIHKLFL